MKTELQYSDMYCLMAAHVYIDLWMETGEASLSLSLSLLFFQYLMWDVYSQCVISKCVCVIVTSLNEVLQRGQGKRHTQRLCLMCHGVCVCVT